MCCCNIYRTGLWHWFKFYDALYYRYGGYIRDMSEMSHLKKQMIHIKLDPTKHESAHDLLIGLADYLLQYTLDYWVVN